MYTRRFFPILACCGLLGLLLAACAAPTPPVVATPVTNPAPNQEEYWPTHGWRTSPPEAQGLDPQALAQMLAQVKSRGMNLHALLIIRHGYIVSENYFGAYGVDTRHELYSCTKSFIATLVGIAVDRGAIPALDRPVLDFFPRLNPANRDARKDSMTVADLLTMRSGLQWEESDAVYQAMYRSSDWVQYVLSRPMAAAPGTRFNYCSGCSHVLSALLQQASGQSTRDFADQYLFKPLGISNWSWESDSSGTAIGGWGLQLTPRDMAKLGYLYLHNGTWDGQTIVSAAWVQAATRQQAATGGSLGYGYQWWTYPSLNAFTATGRYSQLIFVIPASDLVIVTTAGIDDQGEVFRLIEQYVATINK